MSFLYSEESFLSFSSVFADVLGLGFVIGSSLRISETSFGIAKGLSPSMSVICLRSSVSFSSKASESLVGLEIVIKSAYAWTRCLFSFTNFRAVS